VCVEEDLATSFVRIVSGKVEPVSNYLYPGVYIEEIRGPQQISGVGTSTTAFVGWTEKGPDEPTLIDSWNAFLAKFGNFTWGYNVPFAVYNFFAEGGAYAYVVSAKASDGLAAATVVVAPFQFTAASPGLWGNDLAIAIENYPWEDTPSTTLTPTFGIRVLYSAAKVEQDDSKKTVLERLITRYIKNNNLDSAKITRTVDYYVIEEFPGLTIKDLKKGANGQPSSLEAKINGQSLFLRVTVNAETPPAPTALAPALLVTGADSTSGTPVDYQGALAKLDPITDASLLVLPDTGMLDDLKTQQATIQQGINYCESRTPCDMFMIADAPFWLDPQTLRSFKRGEPITPPGATAAIDLENALNSDRGAIYYPWIDFFNTSTARSVTIPPSGAIAGTYSETDSRVGVFKAPAGIRDGKLSSAVSLTALVTEKAQGILNPDGINAIRSLPTYGIVTYGARTLSTDPSLIYISVRRLLTYIEMSLYRGLQWVVFEPNDQKLWGTVRRDVTVFLTQVWTAGGLFGAKDSDAFEVKVDASNNPPATRNQGLLYIDIKVAPVRPAEFVVLRIQQQTLPSA
jgi:uncharacterized protein